MRNLDHEQESKLNMEQTLIPSRKAKQEEKEKAKVEEVKEANGHIDRKLGSASIPNGGII